MKKKIRIMLLASSLSTFAGGMFGPIYAVFVERIGGDLLTAGTAYGAFSIAAGLLIFILSKWEDHVKHQENLVVVSYALDIIGFSGYLLMQKPAHLFIVQVIFGISEALGSPAFDGIYSKYLDKGKFISEWGVLESMQWIVAAAAAGLGGFLAMAYGFTYLFVIMLLISILGFIVSVMLVLGEEEKIIQPHK